MGIKDLYKRNGEEFDTTGYDILTSSDKSLFYANEKEGKLLKVYRDGTPDSLKVKEKVFEDLKVIRSSVMPKMGECLYHGKRGKFFPVVDAYTMDRIKKDHTDILTMGGRLFAVKVAGELSCLSEELAEKRIIMSNPKSNNIIVNNDGTYICDPDSFKKARNLSVNDCSVLNKKIAILYLKMLAAECALYRHNLGDQSDNIAELFNYDITPQTDLTVCVCNSLKEHSILEYIKKRK